MEGGFGYSSIQSISRELFIMGLGMFAGFGVEITDHISCGLRAIWSPSFLHSGWFSPSDDDYFSLLLVFYIL
jgi:hypothetical protein